MALDLERGEFELPESGAPIRADGILELDCGRGERADTG